MKYIWMDSNEPYDGSVLRSHFNYFQNKVLGDSIVAWSGPCDISWASMLDGEDLLSRSPIRSEMMLHFIIEVFERPLFAGVWMQRLFAQIVSEVLFSFMIEEQKSQQMCCHIYRQGDDLYYQESIEEVTGTIGAMGSIGAIGAIGKRRGEFIASIPSSKSRKLSISIATQSPVSVLIHFGINIQSKNTPVPTMGLEDLHIFDPKSFALECMKRWSEEYLSVMEAVRKVRPAQ